MSPYPRMVSTVVLSVCAYFGLLRPTRLLRPTGVDREGDERRDLAVLFRDEDEDAMRSDPFFVPNVTAELQQKKENAFITATITTPSTAPGYDVRNVSLAEYSICRIDAQRGPDCQLPDSSRGYFWSQHYPLR